MLFSTKNTICTLSHVIMPKQAKLPKMAIDFVVRLDQIHDFFHYTTTNKQSYQK